MLQILLWILCKLHVNIVFPLQLVTLPHSLIWQSPRQHLNQFQQLNAWTPTTSTHQLM
jgi:hypothetical protein